MNIKKEESLYLSTYDAAYQEVIPKYHAEAEEKAEKFAYTKAKKAVRNEINNKYKKYLLECIEDPDNDIVLQTDKEKLQFFHDRFISEKGYELKRKPFAIVLKDFLQGLPSSIHIDFYSNDVLDRAVKFGALAESATENENDLILENYFFLLARMILELFEENEVD